MKILLMLLIMFNIDFSHAVSCGQTEIKTSTEKSEVEVFTSVPSHLKGAKIVIVKADGSQEILKAEDYMVVKRKHTRPILREKVSSNTLQCQNTSVKNIISLKAINSYANPEKKLNGNKGTISIERESTLGAQYQRNLGKDIFLGVEGDLNQGAGIILGIGF
jgi:hypothetical protein